MMRYENDTSWWLRKPRSVTILNDTIGWATPWCAVLKRDIETGGDKCDLIHQVADARSGDVAFFLGCTRLVRKEILKLHRHNLVVHASALPRGRGFSPLKWQICEGRNTIPLTLFEAVEGCDEGQIYATTEVQFAGHELLDEMQASVGQASNQLCLNWLSAPQLKRGVPQQGETTEYGRRNQEHQRLNPDATLAEQFNILRTVDNERFPAFFDLYGYRYELRVSKLGSIKE